MRKAWVYFHEELAGTLEETDTGYRFSYQESYLNNSNVQAISLTLPLTQTPYEDNTMFSFFDGLIPEGWLLDIAVENWKIDRRDRMGLLLACCKDCIGAVSIQKEKNG